MTEKHISAKEALLFSQRMAQMSKALWKTVEKDWQQWIKPYELNINEHHILWIAFHLKGASISDVAKFGVMHVSTAFNFSKKLEKRGLLTFSKKENDKRNTYIELTDKGNNILEELMNAFDPSCDTVIEGAKPIWNIYGKFPEIMELMTIVRNIYGEDFMDIFERSFTDLEKQIDEQQVTHVEPEAFTVETKKTVII